VLHRIFDGPLGGGLDAVLATVGIAPRFAGGGHGAEILCGILGIVVVLVAGSIWRKRKLRHVEEVPT
jgi:hypothetical protein